MRITRIGFGFLAALAVLQAWPCAAGAADKEPTTKVTAYLLPKDASEQKKKVTFDLSKKEDQKKFLEYMEARRLDHLETEEAAPNPMAWVADLGIWGIVVFVLLLLILRKLAWTPMLEGLKKREESIKSAVEEAKIARAETQRITAEFKVKMDQAYAEIPKMMDQARKDAQQLAEDLKAKALADIAAERARLRRELDTGRDQALKELQEFAAELATRISAKVLKHAISLEDHRRLVEEALNDLKEARKGA